MMRLWVPLTVAWVVPLLVLTLSPGAGAPSQDDDAAAAPAAAQEQESDTVVVQSVDRDLIEAVSLRFELESEPLPKLAADGLVTQVYAKEGGLIAEGDELISVNRVKVRVHRGEVPFHRDLSFSATGDDVVELARFLTALGYNTSPAAGPRLGADMVRAIKAFQRDANTTPNGVFQPLTTVHIPPGTRRTGKIMVALGDRVAPGDAFTERAPRAVGVDFEPLGPGTLKVAHTSGPFKLTISTTEEPLTVPLGSLDLTEKEANSFYERLLADGIELSKDSDGTESLQGPSLALATPETVGTAPMGALYATPSGTICVFEVTSPAGDPAGATAVSVRSAAAFAGMPGHAAIDADLVGRTIVREAAALHPETTSRCGFDEEK